jgi:LmbE family N-acetylglucosaminyl deacetylase
VKLSETVNLSNRGGCDRHSSASIFIHLLSYAATIFLLATSLHVPSIAQVSASAGHSSAKSASPVEDSVQSDPPGLLYQGTPAPIPEDQGRAGLQWELRRLGTTGRLMQVVAHPDDEDGGMLTLEARGHGVSTLLMTLNRGEGGQNKIGSNLSDVLGVLRTEELLAADQYYGVQDRFSRVADFGFSKNPEETFQKWGGHDLALGDIVRVIRTFQPDVLVARFSGTDRDGHGHHQASALLTKEAFRAAADPRKFPQQIAQGLHPWQAKKLYIGNVCGFGASTCPDATWTLRLNTGVSDPLLGMSYVQFAMKGLRHQESQGAASFTVEPGDRFTFYKLEDSVVPPTRDKDGHEKDFFDGIDTTLPGLAARTGRDKSNALPLRQQLTGIAKKIADATKDVQSGNLPAAAEPLAEAVLTLQRIEEVGKGALSAAKAGFQMRLRTQQQEAEIALNLALNVSLDAVIVSSAASEIVPKEAEAMTTVSPGQEFLVAVKMHNGSNLPLTVNAVKLDVPAGWNTISEKVRPEAVKAGESLRIVFRLRVPKDAAFTRPYWHRDDPDRESVNHIDNEKYATLPFPPPALRARVEYSIGTATTSQQRNGISAAVVTPFLPESGVQRVRPVAVVPAFSVMVKPGTQIISTHNGSTSTVTVGVSSNLTRQAHGILRLELPEGWKSEPQQLAVDFGRRGEKRDFQFKVFPARLQNGRVTIHAVLDSDGEKFSEGYTLVAREDLGSFYYYQPARQRISIVDVIAPHDLRVGYVMGAGDDIPTVLRQVGMDVTLVPAEELASEDLSKFATIVLGIRAYDTQKDVAANNKKLLDFVSAGGTLVVQYNAGVGDFNAGHFTPYPADLSRARVSVEDAPVEILDPGNEIFHSPNAITNKDFDGWVQERGLYFFSKWDDHYKPLLACHDPGEDSQKGGLLRAQYGKGTYIYTGYAFFRQLPAGVPGAVRLFVNLLSVKGSVQ